jgi:hypothetical protein
MADSIAYVDTNFDNGDPSPVDQDEMVPDETTDAIRTSWGEAYDGIFDFEIVGLYRSDNGRSCNMHRVCGEHLVAGDMIQLVPTKVKIQGSEVEEEDAIKVMKIVDNTQGCTVGFIPIVQSRIVTRRGQHRSFAMVNDIYRYSLNTYKVVKSERQCGMASCLLTTIVNTQNNSMTQEDIDIM